MSRRSQHRRSPLSDTSHRVTSVRHVEGETDFLLRRFRPPPPPPARRDDLCKSGKGKIFHADSRPWLFLDAWNYIYLPILEISENNCSVHFYKRDPVSNFFLLFAPTFVPPYVGGRCNVQGRVQVRLDEAASFGPLRGVQYEQDRAITNGQDAAVRRGAGTYYFLKIQTWFFFLE